MNVSGRSPSLLPDLEPNFGEAHSGGKYTGGEHASYSVCVNATGSGQVPKGDGAWELSEGIRAENQLVHGASKHRPARKRDSLTEGTRPDYKSEDGNRQQA